MATETGRGAESGRTGERRESRKVRKVRKNLSGKGLESARRGTKERVGWADAGGGKVKSTEMNDGGDAHSRGSAEVDWTRDQRARKSGACVLKSAQFWFLTSRRVANSARLEFSVTLFICFFSGRSWYTYTSERTALVAVSSV